MKIATIREVPNNFSLTYIGSNKHDNYIRVRGTNTVCDNYNEVTTVGISFNAKSARANPSYIKTINCSVIFNLLVAKEDQTNLAQFSIAFPAAVYAKSFIDDHLLWPFKEHLYTALKKVPGFDSLDLDLTRGWKLLTWQILLVLLKL